MIRQATPTDVAMLLGLAAIYGSAFSAIKIAVPELGPYLLVLVRTALGLVLLIPLAMVHPWRWPQGRSQWLLVVTLCAVNLLAPFWLVAWSQQHIDASLMALLMGAGPLFGMAISHVATRDDRLTPAKCAGLVLGMIGLAIVLGADAVLGLSDASATARLAQAGALLASACYASSGLIVRRLHDIPSEQLATLVLATGVTALLVVWPWFGSTQAWFINPPSLDATLATLYLGVVATGLAYALRFRLIRRVGMGYFGLSIYLVPVFGVLIAAVGLRETIGPTHFGGLILIVSVLLVARRSTLTFPGDPRTKTLEET